MFKHKSPITSARHRVARPYLLTLAPLVVLVAASPAVA